SLQAAGRAESTEAAHPAKSGEALQTAPAHHSTQAAQVGHGADRADTAESAKTTKARQHDRDLTAFHNTVVAADLEDLRCVVVVIEVEIVSLAAGCPEIYRQGKAL